MDYTRINEEFYAHNHWGIDRSTHKWFSKYVKAKIIKKFMKNVTTKDVLYDCAGGVGNWAAHFMNDYKKVIVSDISKTALSNIPEKNIVKIHCSAIHNTLPNESVDCILLIDVFEHIAENDLLKMMKDLRRILKKNGRIIIFTSLRGWGLGSIIQRITNPRKRLLGSEHLEGHVNRLTLNEFKTLFTTARLTIEEYTFYSIIFQQLTDALKDNLARLTSTLLHKKKADERAGREGQSIKEELRKKEEHPLLKIPLAICSYISYLDTLLFGKTIPGNTIFFSLKKQ